mmetsp:Transcript_63048/g.186240  ORF Transcript_63048/g.186240 Transcript_63048/m.186240 type:complete len:741 (-) Transcript_63048:110-2332(-)
MTPSPFSPSPTPMSFPPTHCAPTAAETTKALTLREVDSRYEQLGCLGRGGFASVFLARKRHTSNRLVAIKVMSIDKSDDEYAVESFMRELDAVVSLNTRDDGTDEGEERDQGIIFFREWFRGRSSSEDGGCFGSPSAFIVMNYVEGGTLADLLDADKRGDEPFAERRVAWYVLQLCDALAYAHERNVSHHDVKSENILVDARRGGTLVLSDFGTSVRPGQERIGFTQAYASPELLAAHRADDFDGFSSLDPRKVDAFGLGCVALELLMRSTVFDLRALEGTTLADVASVPGRLESAFERMAPDKSHYSAALREGVVRRLLDPNPMTRASPSDYPLHFRQDPASPLICPSLQATHVPVPGSHLTMDNIHLGMYVRRGPDWEDGDADGGEGSVGVVAALDSDALYTEVVWPSGTRDTYRIGASLKMELTVGPIPLSNGMSNGFLASRDVSKYRPGSTFDVPDHPAQGMVVADVVDRGVFLVPPPNFRVHHDYKAVPRIPKPPDDSPTLGAHPGDPEPHPASWDVSLGELCELSDGSAEFQGVANLFHSPSGGVPKTQFTILSVERVQSFRLWSAYARRKEDVAAENWSCPNERRLFHGTSVTTPDTIMNDAVGFDPRFSAEGAYGRGAYFAANAEYSDKFRHIAPGGTFQMFLARVTLGRVEEPTGHDLRSTIRPGPGCHSVVGLSQLRNGTASFVHVIYETSTQAYPEYLITYTDRPHDYIRTGSRRIVKAARPTGAFPFS